MNPKNCRTIDANDSLFGLWISIITHYKCLLTLWKTMQSNGIDEKIIIQSIVHSYENIQLFMKVLINRYELTELARIPLKSEDLIRETEEMIKDTYHFSHGCMASLYNIRKISCLHTSILEDLLWLEYISVQKKMENNPEKKWLTDHVFNPISPK
ncbi:hypothetical protein MUB24_05245 [Lederbergia sp. NSJ-179]|uniref:hypothetical protein n=1 Tax=Lederbergia sp. NSJ-179 TaxID=2931402 RepID=UPI001FD48B8F|nr:hypothetical protein [Lederbergia sp. NSJ-179]MCJ7840329.1 hypothetical protein [Lederbergia sp. NSJ-179]